MGKYFTQAYDYWQDQPGNYHHVEGRSKAQKAHACVQLFATASHPVCDYPGTTTWSSMIDQIK